MLIAISEREYKGLIERTEEAIRKEFDFYNRSIDFKIRAELIAEAESLGCSQDFISQLKKDA